VAILATGFVLFTLLVNGTTLRLLIRLVGLDRLSTVDQALRGRCLDGSVNLKAGMAVRLARFS